MKRILSEMKDILDGINRLDATVEKIKKTEGLLIESKQNEAKRGEKRIKT